jgi:hypothetical protein
MLLTIWTHDLLGATVEVKFLAGASPVVRHNWRPRHTDIRGRGGFVLRASACNLERSFGPSGFEILGHCRVRSGLHKDV